MEWRFLSLFPTIWAENWCEAGFWQGLHTQIFSPIGPIMAEKSPVEITVNNCDNLNSKRCINLDSALTNL